MGEMQTGPSRMLEWFDISEPNIWETLWQRDCKSELGEWDSLGSNLTLPVSIPVPGVSVSSISYQEDDNSGDVVPLLAGRGSE